MKYSRLLAGFTLILPLACAAQEPPASTPLQRAVDIARAAGLDGVVALGDAAGPHAAALGLADRETKRAHRIDETWPWASVTKQITAILVMLEVEEGRLTLDTTLAAVLPSFRGTSGDRITMRQLLQHTAGLPNPDDTPETASGVPAFYGESGPAIADRARATGYCSGPPTGEPGVAFVYNNCDYLVLGAVLERLTGKPYARSIADRLGPLTAGVPRMAPDGRPSGGTDVIGYDAKGRYPSLNIATFGAAGALTGTAADLLAIDQALLDRRLLGKAATDVMWSGDPKLGYEALGAWSFSARLPGCSAPVRLIERRGDVAGIQVRNVLAPDLHLAFVAFTNRDDLDFGEVWQGRGLTYALLGAAFCPPPR